MAAYISFKELRRREVEDIDYRIRCRQGRTGILVMAPHGGNIEPGTSRIADAIAGTEHAFYAFEGLKTGRNSRLHITSRRFDEPAGCRLAADADTVLTIHGCSDSESLVFVGGLDRALAANVWKALARDAFHLKESPRISGKHPQNICNRCRSGMGVQLEISAGLRKRMFTYHPKCDPTQTDVFYNFVSALKAVLANSHSP
ncbi:MAG: poly-gamma-glutamate hydrolase family protein [Deltaproteobacteria bacterium]|nr:poly-gamma-glutamate hydrolase family protein [Deltaproteobacteria bacterium]